MNITGLDHMEEQLRGMSQAMEQEYWKLGKNLQSQSFHKRLYQRTAMQLQAEVLNSLQQLDEARDALIQLRKFAKKENASFAEQMEGQS